MKKKAKSQKAEPKPEPKKEKVVGGYKVVIPIWIDGVQRFPGYTLTASDIGFLNSRGTLDHVVNKLGAIEAI